jgi:hypothetical protein
MNRRSVNIDRSLHVLSQQVITHSIVQLCVQDPRRTMDYFKIQQFLNLGFQIFEVFHLGPLSTATENGNLMSVPEIYLCTHEKVSMAVMSRDSYLMEVECNGFRNHLSSFHVRSNNGMLLVMIF